MIGHIPTYELVDGDVTRTLEGYFANHAEPPVALAYLDLALYEPSKRVLGSPKPPMVKGGLAAKDELTPRKTPAKRPRSFGEAFGLGRNAIYRSTFLPDRSYMVV